MNLERTRYDYRKKKKMSRLVNICIGAVGILIIFFAFQLFLKSPSEQATTNLEEENQELVEDSAPNDDEIPPVVDHTPVEGEIIESDPMIEEGMEEEPTPQTEEVPQQQVSGEWQAIGTVQSEPFVAVFEKEHVNWQEMTRAFQIATGLGDDMIIWWAQNGGNHQSAVGFVSTYENRNTPYEVRLEWVPNQGWKPVNVQPRSTNEYLPSED